MVFQYMYLILSYRTLLLPYFFTVLWARQWFRLVYITRPSLQLPLPSLIVCFIALYHIVSCNKCISLLPFPATFVLCYPVLPCLAFPDHTCSCLVKYSLFLSYLTLHDLALFFAFAYLARPYSMHSLGLPYLILH